MQSINRRGLLQIGTLAGLGIDLAGMLPNGVLPTASAAAPGKSHTGKQPVLKSCILIFCNGVNAGQIYGASDRSGAFPVSDPVGPADLAATLFSRFNLDPAAEIFDQTGRPFRLAEGKPISALFAGTA
jgi:hypothetical protein